MGDRRFLHSVGLALLVVGGIGVLTSLYSLGFWLAERGGSIWLGKAHSYLFEWSDHGPFYYIVVGMFSGLGVFLGRSLRRETTTPENALRMLGRVGLWIWGFLAALNLVRILASWILYPSRFSLSELVFGSRNATYMWPPWDRGYEAQGYFIRQLIYPGPHSPAWLMLDMVVSPTFWTVGPLLLSLHSWRGLDSKLADRAFAAFAFLLAGMTLASSYWLVAANWARFGFDPEGRVVEFVDIPGFGAIPIYLVFVASMICMAVLLFCRNSPRAIG